MVASICPQFRVEVALSVVGILGQSMLKSLVNCFMPADG